MGAVPFRGEMRARHRTRERGGCQPSCAGYCSLPLPLSLPRLPADNRDRVIAPPHGETADSADRRRFYRGHLISAHRSHRWTRIPPQHHRLPQMTQMDADFIAGLCRFSIGVLELRPSGPPPATQRRTIGVVVRRMIEGLRPRRWHAGGLPPNRNRYTGTLYREGCPAAPLCGSCRFAGRSSLHNGVPGTPR